MAKGFEFQLSDGTVLQLVPKTGVTECSISHGDTKIEVNVSSAAFKVIAPEGKAIAAIPTVVRFNTKDLVVGDCKSPLLTGDEPHIMRACMSCDGKSCCVTNGCLDCGCGWICD